MVRQETRLTFYGGVDEIGGNKILLEDRDTKVFFDFGMSFAMKGLFYSPPFLSPKTGRSLQEFGALPQVDGVYKFDEKPSEIDAVFVSHGHLDHSAYLSFIKREIPVYCGETTCTMLRAQSEMRRADLEFNIEGLKFKTFKTGRKIHLGNLEVEPVHVDHSIPGAYGFVIHTSNGSIIHTGDFRHHGAKREMTDDSVEKAREADPVAMVTEATNITGATVSSEAEVEEKLDSIVRESGGIVLAEFAHGDVDRFNSFYRVARKNHRRLAISLKQAYLLNALCSDTGLSIPNMNDKDILIFRKSKATRYKWEERLESRFPGRIKSAFELSKQQCKVILVMSFYDLEELVELQPQAGSCYVLSASEPFNEEMEIDYGKLVNWLQHYGLAQYHVHVSGHMMPFQLKSILKDIKPLKIFPIHTESAELFRKFMGDLKGKVVGTQKGKQYKM